MIRFACGTCGSSLRAPPGLAGKKGRCAHCGKVNQVPVVLSVDVKRTTAVASAAAGSPFRSTADMVARATTVEGSIELSSGPRFLTAPLERPTVPNETLDFFDQVASRINDFADPVAEAGADYQARTPRYAGAPTPRRAPIDPAVATDFGPDDLPPARAYEAQPDHTGPDMMRIVMASLTIGTIVGFCLGLFASKWMM
jgi:hypothetical protein